jgi:murein DD-endopeptidase MepM/ murein hydrolase activator NlpD
MLKKLLIIAAILFAVFAFANNFEPEIELFEQSKRTVTAPFKYAALLSRQPEEKIKIPVRNIKAGQIADTWGAPRGNDRTHQGQDIFAPRNTPVYSAVDGYVWRIAENNLGGNTVWIIGAGGRVYYYAHLERYAENLQVGESVTFDTILGYVGTSGNARGTPPHLHFGVYTTGGAINPLSLFE